MDALGLLRRDHRELRKLVAELEGSGDRAIRTRAKLVARLQTALAVHETVEEEVLFRALCADASSQELVREARSGHRSLDRRLDELVQLPSGHPSHRATTARLREALVDHLTEEERGVFGRARQVLGLEKLDELGRRIEELRSIDGPGA